MKVLTSGIILELFRKTNQNAGMWWSNGTGGGGGGCNGTLHLTGHVSHCSPPMVGLFLDDAAGTYTLRLFAVIAQGHSPLVLQLYQLLPQMTESHPPRLPQIYPHIFWPKMTQYITQSYHSCVQTYCFNKWHSQKPLSYTSWHEGFLEAGPKEKAFDGMKAVKTLILTSTTVKDKLLEEPTQKMKGRKTYPPKKFIRKQTSTVRKNRNAE